MLRNGTRSTIMPSGNILIRDMAAGLTAVANRDGSYRHGVKAVWERWRAVLSDHRLGEDSHQTRKTGTIPPLGTLGA